MLALDPAFKKVIDAVVLGDMKIVKPALHELHEAREEVEMAVKGGKEITLQKNQDKPKEFVELDDKFHEEMEVLAKAAEEGNKNRVLKQTHTLLDACVVCHEGTRNEKGHKIFLRKTSLTLPLPWGERGRVRGLLGLLLVGAVSLLLTTCSLLRPKVYVPDMDPGFCMNCHQQVTPGLFQSWVESKHAKKGVHCMTCHIDHEFASKQKSMVFPEKCGECHKKELAEFRKSRHSIGFERMRIQGEYLSIPQEIRAAFCERCHIIEKRCNSCHSSHRFSLKEARDPDACGSCHLGPDHPHKEMYETSLHGTIYKVTQDPDRAPRCVTCHMPQGTHNSSFGIARGPVGTAEEVVDLRETPISKEEQDRRRKKCLGFVWDATQAVCSGAVRKCRPREAGRI
jgi:cytochrome c556